MRRISSQAAKPSQPAGRITSGKPGSRTGGYRHLGRLVRAEIEARMRLDAVDIYGLSEVMGPGVAQECVERKDGPTIWEDHFYPEIIHPDTGAVLPDGEEGELVFTTLSKEAMPVCSTIFLRARKDQRRSNMEARRLIHRVRNSE